MLSLFGRYCFVLAAALLPALSASAQTLTALDTGSGVLTETTGKTVHPFSTQDFGRRQYASGRSVLVPEGDAKRLLAQARAKLPQGLVAFVGVTNSLARPEPPGVELVVAEGSCQFDILRIAATDGVDHGLGTEDIIKELMLWDKEFGIDIWQAETDTLQLRLKSQPKNINAFAKRVYRFCPDIVDQGVGSVEELATLIAREQAVFLRWD